MGKIYLLVTWERFWVLHGAPKPIFVGDQPPTCKALAILLHPNNHAISTLPPTIVYPEIRDWFAVDPWFVIAPRLLRDCSAIVKPAWLGPCSPWIFWWCSYQNHQEIISSHIKWGCFPIFSHQKMVIFHSSMVPSRLEGPSAMAWETPWVARWGI